MAFKYFFTCVVCLLLALGASTSHAADVDAESKRLYKEGTKQYNLGEFEEAITAYKSGYDAKPDPVFLYNIAQAYRLWGKPDKAVFFYKSFLRNLPEAPNRPEVERRISEMQAELAKQSKQGAAGSTPLETQPVSPAVPASVGAPPAVAPAAPMAMAPALPEQTDGTSLTQTASSGNNDAVYKQWWFWTAIGAVALGTVAIIAVSSGGGNAAPMADFPVKKVF